MQIAIRFSGGIKSDLGNHNYEEVLCFALDRFEHRLKHVDLFVEDVNGPRGGVDKQCRCVLYLKNMSPVIIKGRGEHLGALILRVANRAAFVLSQRFDRRNKRVLKNRHASRHELVSAFGQEDQSFVASGDVNAANYPMTLVLNHDR